jgi:hypothetical protein
MELCKPCKDVLEKMIEEEDVGLLEANRQHSLVLQCFYAGRLALLVDLVRGTNTRKEEALATITQGPRQITEVKR